MIKRCRDPIDEGMQLSIYFLRVAWFPNSYGVRDKPKMQQRGIQWIYEFPKPDPNCAVRLEEQ